MQTTRAIFAEPRARNAERSRELLRVVLMASPPRFHQYMPVGPYFSIAISNKVEFGHTYEIAFERTS